jgi:hypothetical protein
MSWFFVFFFISGFCSILYEIVWLRLAMAQFGGMPPRATADFVEWGPEPQAEVQFGIILNRELSLDQMISGAPNVHALTDHRPENEYYILCESLPERWLSGLGIPH